MILQVGGSHVFVSKCCRVLFRALSLTGTDLFIGTTPRMSRLCRGGLGRLIHVVSQPNKEDNTWHIFISAPSGVCKQGSMGLTIQQKATSSSLSSWICYKTTEIISRDVLGYSCTMVSDVSGKYSRNENLDPFHGDCTTLCPSRMLAAESSSRSLAPEPLGIKFICPVCRTNISPPPTSPYSAE